MWVHLYFLLLLFVPGMNLGGRYDQQVLYKPAVTSWITEVEQNASPWPRAVQRSQTCSSVAVPGAGSWASPSWLGWGWGGGATLTAFPEPSSALALFLHYLLPPSVLRTMDHALFTWHWDCLWVAGSYLVFPVPSNLPSHWLQRTNRMSLSFQNSGDSAWQNLVPAAWHSITYSCFPLSFLVLISVPMFSAFCSWIQTISFFPIYLLMVHDSSEIL